MFGFKEIGKFKNWEDLGLEVRAVKAHLLRHSEDFFKENLYFD